MSAAGLSVRMFPTGQGGQEAGGSAKGRGVMKATIQREIPVKGSDAVQGWGVIKNRVTKCQVANRILVTSQLPGNHPGRWFAAHSHASAHSVVAAEEDPALKAETGRPGRPSGYLIDCRTPLSTPRVTCTAAFFRWPTMP
jgi:hypothetical protein